MKSSIVGILIKIHRKNNNLTCATVALKLNTTIQFISNIERGVSLVPWNKLNTLSEVLNIPVRDLAAANLQSTKAYRQFEKFI